MSTKQPTGKVLLKIVLALFALGAVAVIAGGVYVYRNPLALHVRNTRGALDVSGFERVEVDVTSGKLVVWRGAPSSGEPGPDLVFLHGAGDQAGAWAKTTPGLRDRYRVHLLDLPGHGESEPLDGPLAYSVVLAGVEDYLDGLKRPTLVGHSMGAWLATVYAHRHPDNVTRLLAVNGGALHAGDTGVNLLPRDREEARRTMAALRDPSSPEIPGFVLDDVVRRSAAGPIGRLTAELDDMERHLLDGRLGEIRTPVDLIWGESDRHLDLDYARRLERELPAARLTTIERCGHLPPNECPGPFREALEQVLALDPPAPNEPRGDAEMPGDQNDPR